VIGIAATLTSNKPNIYLMGYSTQPNL